MQWKCTVCLDEYKDPRLLICSHTFCTECLAGVMEGGRVRPARIKCPECREYTKVSKLKNTQVDSQPATLSRQACVVHGVSQSVRECVQSSMSIKRKSLTNGGGGSAPRVLL